MLLVHKTEFDLIAEFIERKIDYNNSYMLGIGDVVISERTVIEMKRGGYNESGNYVHDFVASIKDQRLFIQCQNMKDMYERRILIIENYDRLFEDKSIPRTAILSSLASISTKYGISVIPANSIEDAIHIILKCIEYDKKDGYYTPVNKHPKPKTLYDKQIYLLSGLIGVKLSKARRLLEYFNTPIEVLKAIDDAKFVIPPRGKNKKLTGPFTKVKGFSNIFINKNQLLLNQPSELAILNVNI